MKIGKRSCVDLCSKYSIFVHACAKGQFLRGQLLDWMRRGQFVRIVPSGGDNNKLCLGSHFSWTKLSFTFQWTQKLDRSMKPRNEDNYYRSAESAAAVFPSSSLSSVQPIRNQRHRQFFRYLLISGGFPRLSSLPPLVFNHSVNRGGGG